ncbi:MAG: hypothetical protein HDQ88_03280 [Clostridia bacterium]|nr:hypothetical protein [Clostridia bacterium]
MREPTGRLDPNGNEYHVGDLVLNELFGDVWLVDHWLPDDDPGPDDTGFCFMQYCSHDLMVIDIEEPESFAILSRPGDEDYQKIYDECVEVARKMSDGW